MNYVLNALELQVPQGIDLLKQDRINIADALGDEFTINLSNKNQKANMILGKMFEIQKDFSEPSSVEFVFPSILRVGINTYVLQGIDDNASGSKSIGSNLLDSIMGKTTFSNIGTFAKYTAIPSQYASEELSPIAFSSENAEAYKRYIDKKEAIVFNTNIVDTAKEEKQPTQQSTSVKEGVKKPAENIIITDTKEGVDSEIGVSQGQLDASEDSLEALMKMLAGTQQPVADEVPKIQRGRYVTYNGGTYIVTQQNADSTWQIYNPLLEGAKAKISVSESNIKALGTLAKIIEYKDSEYIVTSKNTIISLTTNKKMMWGENDGNRKAILAMALQNRTIIKPNNRPSIDPTDENNC